MSEKNLNLQEVISSIRQKKYHPVCLLHGDEPFFIDIISDFIGNNVLTEAEKSFNQVILYGGILKHRRLQIMPVVSQ